MAATELNIESIGMLIGSGMGITGAGFLLFKGAITWLGRQGLISAGDDSQKDLIERLTVDAENYRTKLEASEAARQKDRDDHHKEMIELRDLHNDVLMLTGELKVQNKMLRMLLIQRGMTAAELDAALEIQL